MPLLERDDQLRAADGYLADAADGHGRLLFVAGEAGVGKTTFVTAVVTAAGAGARVAVGRCVMVGLGVAVGTRVLVGRRRVAAGLRAAVGTGRGV